VDDVAGLGPDGSGPGDEADVVLVVILVPIAGVFFYCFLAPDAPRRVLGRDDVRVQPDEPIKCVKCQTVIPGDATVCPKCGWSYAHKAAE
jgi:hypothetical protein